MRPVHGTPVAVRKHRLIGKFSLNQRELFRIGRHARLPLFESPGLLLAPKQPTASRAQRLATFESTKGNQ